MNRENNNYKSDRTATERKANLRNTAEELLHKAIHTTPAVTESTLHELQVHQIELELQNAELARTHIELELLRARYFDLYDVAPVSYFTLSDHGIILLANLTATKLLAIERNKLLQQRFTKFVLHDDQDIFYLHRQQLLNSELPQSFQMRMVNSLGIPFWAQITATLVQNRDGITEQRLTATDISEHKHTEEQLRHAQKMHALGLLTGGIAHDFNNLLGIILGNVDLLKRKADLDSRSIHRLDIIRSTGYRAVDLVKQLLNYSSTTATKTTIVNINQLLQQMRELFQLSVTTEVEIVQNLTTELWHTNINSHDFQDAILNMVINARDAMSGRGKLIFATRNYVAKDGYHSRNRGITPGEYVELTLSDNGSGITELQKQQIFDPFFTTKECGKGTGLGLSLVHGFVQRSHGYIICDSELGVGTTFTIYLPRTEKTNFVFEQKEEELSLPLGSETILIVDDEEHLLELTKQLLITQGYSVITANYSKEALQLLTEHPEVSLLFSDVVMPGGMNGIQLANEVKKLYPNLKILLTSGNLELKEAVPEKDRIDCDILKKPYSHTELAMCVRRCLDS